MRTEFTSMVKKSGNSYCVFIPKMQMEILGLKERDIVKVELTTLDKNGNVQE